jgi:hypothetical protein
MGSDENCLTWIQANRQPAASGDSSPADQRRERRERRPRRE